MNRWDAEQAVAQMLQNGYNHYSRAEERRIITARLLGLEALPPRGSIDEFPLADQPLRSMKNGLIAWVAVVCRVAMDLGADDLKGYMLSDYYINEIEEKASRDSWKKVIRTVLDHYIELVREGREGRYSPRIKQALRHIKRRVFEPCGLRELAGDLGLNPNYLSWLFKKETGLTLTRYVQQVKIEEAKRLMAIREHSLSDIADILRFTSLSYFSRVFKRLTGCSPREYLAERRKSAPAATAPAVPTSAGSAPPEPGRYPRP
jgi:AraC-like DNA-binding protein